MNLEQGKKVCPLTPDVLEKKLNGKNTGSVDEKQPLQAGPDNRSMVVFSIEDDDMEEADGGPGLFMEPVGAESGRKAAELTVTKASEKGRLPSQTTAAQRREDTRP